MKISGLKTMIYNRLHREEIYSRAEYWDAKAEEFKGLAVSMWKNEKLNHLYNAEVMEAFDRFLRDARDQVILDLGCGTGRGSRYLANKGAQVVGVDFSAKVVEIARNESPSENISFRVQSMFDIDDVNAFDHVVSWGSMTVACRNREDLQKVMTRLYAALKPGGKLLLMEPIHRGFLHRVLNLSPREFMDVVRASGFRINDVVKLHFWPARIALAYINWPGFVTTPTYTLGQWIMHVLFRNRTFGDYTLISALKDIKEPASATTPGELAREK